MGINCIRSEEDYCLCLERVRQLWGAPKGTPEGDELAQLMGMAEAYETGQCPVGIPS